MAEFLISWNINLVLLSYALSFLGCLIGVYLSEQFRLSVVERKGLINPTLILCLISISVGGIGGWSMHFIGMQAMTIHDLHTDQDVKMNFDIFLTCISLMSIILFIFLGMWIATRDRAFFKSSLDVAEHLVSDGKVLSIREMKDKRSMRNLALFNGLRPLSCGGLVTGGGMCIMHYIGMTAQTGDIAIEWNSGIVFASLIIAVVVSITAFWIMFRLLSLYPTIELLRIGSALVMALAACSTHYTGMQAAIYHRRSHPLSFSATLTSETAALICIVSGLIVSILIIMVIMADLRSFYIRNAYIAQKSEMILNEMESCQVPEVKYLIERLYEVRKRSSTLYKHSSNITNNIKTLETSMKSNPTNHTNISSSHTSKQNHDYSTNKKQHSNTLSSATPLSTPDDNHHIIQTQRLSVDISTTTSIGQYTTPPPITSTATKQTLTTKLTPNNTATNSNPLNNSTPALTDKSASSISLDQKNKVENENPEENSISLTNTFLNINNNIENKHNENIV